uniref:Uncharacterized protein n=1 Tax=Acidithiobacillus sulfuriphilus TaxID=1867749 RepID=A0A3M8R7R2_9PROT|nr:hypothetical protein EC580_05670 [Acidithiobacillus sulfuriphilus]
MPPTISAAIRAEPSTAPVAAAEKDAMPTTAASTGFRSRPGKMVCAKMAVSALKLAGHLTPGNG